jgi:hypothetical protein
MGERGGSAARATVAPLAAQSLYYTFVVNNCFVDKPYWLTLKRDFIKKFNEYGRSNNKFFPFLHCSASAKKWIKFHLQDVNTYSHILRMLACGDKHWFACAAAFIPEAQCIICRGECEIARPRWEFTLFKLEHRRLCGGRMQSALEYTTSRMIRVLGADCTRSGSLYYLIKLQRAMHSWVSFI